MTTRMLIDARHREETRVAVVTGNRIEELDFESAEHKQLKGNIYLAKVTRVEPSLQAAFVDYGGNRHGFLAFAEIHPDYYQIPKEDRDKLLAEEAEAAAEEAALREQEEDEDNEPAEIIKSEAAGEEDTDLIEVDDDDAIDTIDIEEGQEPDLDSDEEEEDEEESSDNGSEDVDGEKDKAEGDDKQPRKGRGRGNRRRRGSRKGRGRGKAKASDEARAKRMNLRRRYKIQDVIHRRQVLLVQVVKEERGNKGAALTTYMSLAGRYCVLMPNTSHGGGISRKISNASDRKRLKSIVAEMKLPSTMGCIVRTAGLSRTKAEIKRDFDYLARLWDEIREKTLKGSAPMLIHSDSDLIKRAIRDIYNRDIGEVMVEGDDGYRAAKDFMKLLMPSHAKRVKQYSDSVPLFQRYSVEDQLSAMFQPVVQLKSGGYIVINPTEALVSIDINSGRSTKEHGIEQTALATNLEAAKEIARQLRLRDMAGLVVIDFIDMERHSNSRKVERAMKEALKNDRARIQVGRISSFGLMEMSRQRLRTGVLEASTRVCPHCEGTGLVRTASSSALSALRIIEEEAARGKGSEILLQASQEATIYVLNHKRSELAAIEESYGVSISITPNEESEGARMSVGASGPKPEKRAKLPPIVDDDDAEDSSEKPGDEAQDEGRGKRKRRRGRRGGRGRARDGESEVEKSADDKDATDEKPAKKRSGGRKKADKTAEESEEAATGEAKEEKPKRRRRTKAEIAADKEEEGKTAKKEQEAEKPKRKRAAATKTAKADEKAAEQAAEDVKPKRKPRAKKAGSADETEKPKKRTPRAKTADDEKAAEAEKPAAKRSNAKTAKGDGDAASDEAKPEKARSGWWQRTFG